MGVYLCEHDFLFANILFKLYVYCCTVVGVINENSLRYSITVQTALFKLAISYTIIIHIVGFKVDLQYSLFINVYKYMSYPATIGLKNMLGFSECTALMGRFSTAPGCNSPQNPMLSSPKW